LLYAPRFQQSRIDGLEAHQGEADGEGQQGHHLDPPRSRAALEHHSRPAARRHYRGHEGDGLGPGQGVDIRRDSGEYHHQPAQPRPHTALDPPQAERRECPQKHAAGRYRPRIGNAVAEQPQTATGGNGERQYPRVVKHDSAERDEEEHQKRSEDDNHIEEHPDAVPSRRDRALNVCPGSREAAHNAVPGYLMKISASSDRLGSSQSNRASYCTFMLATPPTSKHSGSTARGLTGRWLHPNFTT